MKYKYKVIINKAGRNANRYTYDYGQTKNVQIAVAKNSAVISVQLTKKYEPEEALSGNGYLFPDALRKVLLVHMLLYSKNIYIEKIIYQVNGKSETKTYDYKKDKPLIYSMVLEDMKHPFVHKWDDEAVKTVVSLPKSRYDSRMSALFALICSKSKTLEAERFIYLWMSFNGMYRYFSSLIEEQQNVEINSEAAQLNCLQRLYKLGSVTVRDNEVKKNAAQKVSAFIKRTDENITKEYLKSDRSNEFKEELKSILVDKDNNPLDIEPYGYMLIHYPYYYRCSTFHAETAVLLFSFADDGDLKRLRTINGLLEDFIEENLRLWFSEKHFSEFLIPKARELELPKNVKKKNKDNKKTEK